MFNLKYLYLIPVVSLYFLYKQSHSVNQYQFDLNDGPSTKGFGITRGGTGNLGFQKDSRVGGLPPNLRNKYEDKPVDEYDYDAEEKNSVDGKNKIVIILGANLEGGVNKWKGAQEWSLERSSIVNKKRYSRIHGYDLVIKDYTKQKKYSNEHRENWQKFDLIKSVMDEYSTGDWFWYLDLYTLIMEPEISLEDLILSKLNETLERDLSYFNPNKLKIDANFVDFEEPINMILSQDCGGFNLHSFLIQKSEWSYGLFDVLFDPIIYLQNKHNWKNDEKNALEYYYDQFGFVRSRIGFIPNRLIAALPQGACPDYKFDDRFFYNETTRDFLVDMNGCEFNRNCWDEMEYFKEKSDDLHKSWFKKLFNF